MTTISGLRADIIPHQAFALHKWFYSSPLWYYHRPGSTEEIRADRTFYKLVDPDLRELCRLLNEAGLQTTPSCQGHFYPRERFERIWAELQREAPLIGGDGLEVRDSETDRPHLFRDPDYRVPWPDFRAFYEQASAHQNAGYLGIILPEASPLLPLLMSQSYGSPGARMSHDQELSDALGRPLISIVVDPNTPEERKREWRAITGHLRTAIEQASAAPA